MGDPTIVIDDGSHVPAHVRETFRLLFPHVVMGGMYVIEDVQTSYWPESGGSENLDEPTTSMAMVKSLLDGLNYEEFVAESYVPTYTDVSVVGVHAYHNLVFIDKGKNAEGTRKRVHQRSAPRPGTPAAAGSPTGPDTAAGAPSPAPAPEAPANPVDDPADRPADPGTET